MNSASDMRQFSKQPINQTDKVIGTDIELMKDNKLKQIPDSGKRVLNPIASVMGRHYENNC